MPESAEAREVEVLLRERNVSLVVDDVAGVVVGQTIQMQAENFWLFYYLFVLGKVHRDTRHLVGAGVARNLFESFELINEFVFVDV